MPTLDELLVNERALANGTGETYRTRCAPEAVFVLPGMVLDLEQCAAAVDGSPTSGWDAVDLDEPRLLTAGADAVAIVYTFTGRRGENVYRACMSSLYRIDDDGEPRLILHQQTPLS
ncbi:nuclear transport factor 2 family protein [Georgenia deserti]|uniref:Nuclear transport factor 2 family protein n=1 Tax=Georgenia deserti TaxID=2093781 RepID=A0ABW4LA32_9MICO